MTRYSPELKMAVTARYDRYRQIWVKCEDGVIYSPSELKLIEGFDSKLTAHRIKKVFNGKIVGNK